MFRSIEHAKSQVKDKLKEVEKQLGQSKVYSSGEVAKAREAIKVSDFEKCDFDALTFGSLKDTKRRLQDTLRAHLMIATKKYLMVPQGSSELVKPSGFSMDDRVFLFIPGSILTNKLPKQSNMAYYDIDSTVEKNTPK